MSKRTLYSIVTPLPATVSRATAIAALHNHSEMIQLNPLVINHARSKAAANCSADEFHAIWYTLTDRISYFPGITGKVSYKACFHDLPTGLQTHVYAPAGLEIKEKWSIGGNEPGEQREVLELGLSGVPRDGLYLREDVDMSCSILLTSFVKKNLRKAHQVLVDRLVVKADLEEDRRVRDGYTSRIPSLTNSSVASSLRSRSSVGSDHLAARNTRMSISEFLIAEAQSSRGPLPSRNSMNSTRHSGSVHSSSDNGRARTAGAPPSKFASSTGSLRRGSYFSVQGRGQAAHIPLSQTYQLPDSTMLSTYHKPGMPIQIPYDPATYYTSGSNKRPYPVQSRPVIVPPSPPVQIAELSADDTVIAPYERQQSFHEEQIWNYLGTVSASDVANQTNCAASWSASPPMSPSSVGFSAPRTAMYDELSTPRPPSLEADGADTVVKAREGLLYRSPTVLHRRQERLMFNQDQQQQQQRQQQQPPKWPDRRTSLTYSVSVYGDDNSVVGGSSCEGVDPIYASPVINGRSSCSGMSMSSAWSPPPIVPIRHALHGIRPVAVTA